MEEAPIRVLATAMHPTLEQLQAFDSGQMAEPDASAIEDHLATCADCMAQVEHGSGAGFAERTDPLCVPR